MFTDFVGVTSRISLNTVDTQNIIDYCNYSDIIKYGKWIDISSEYAANNLEKLKKHNFELISKEQIKKQYKRPSILNQTADVIKFDCDDNQVSHSLSFEYYLNINYNKNTCKLFHFFNEIAFLNLINNTNIYIIGDSQSWQHYLSLIGRLSSSTNYIIQFIEHSSNKECIDFIHNLETNVSKHHWMSYNEHKEACRRLSISFSPSNYNVNITMIRNNFMMASIYYFDTNYYQKYWNIVLFKYLLKSDKNIKNIFIINSGSHWTAAYHKSKYLLVETMNYLNILIQKITNNKSYIIYRTSLMGHQDCYKYNKLYSDNFIIANKLNGMPYHWDKLDEFDEAVINNLTNINNFYVWNVSSFFRAMSLGHVSPKDCFHYCLPGPLYWWNVMLYHFLREYIY